MNVAPADCPHRPARARLGPAGRCHGRAAVVRLMAAGALLGLPLGLLGAEPPRLAQSQLGVPGVVLGIIGYTAWPVANDVLQVCITRGAVEASEIVRQLPLQPGRRRLEAVMVEANQRLPPGCDVLFADGWSTAALREVLTELAFRPVLTVGRGPEFCTDGGMFCLEPDPQGGTRFEVNLDAIARSGLRVHPQVLRLARSAPRGA